MLAFGFSKRGRRVGWSQGIAERPTEPPDHDVMRAHKEQYAWAMAVELYDPAVLESMAVEHLAANDWALAFAYAYYTFCCCDHPGAYQLPGYRDRLRPAALATAVASLGALPQTPEQYSKDLIFLVREVGEWSDLSPVVVVQEHGRAAAVEWFSNQLALWTWIEHAEGIVGCSFDDTVDASSIAESLRGRVAHLKSGRPLY